MSDLRRSVSTSRQQPMQDSGAWSFTRFQKEDTEQSITDRFQEQVARYSRRIAVKAGSHKLTYDELNKAANRIAQVILSQRGEGEEPIALLMEQGISLLAAILGVLKTGKIYVPLDPSLPGARVTYILEDSQAKLIVTNGENLRLAHEMAQDAHQIINIDKMDSSVSCENPNLVISPDTLACIFYTSGTTGKPKGIAENHRNILHEVMVRTNQLRIYPDDRMCFFKSLNFAGSVRKVYPPLLNGASLCLLNVKKEGIANLANWLVQEGITVLGGRQIIRELMEMLIGEEEFPRIREVTFGGDTIYRRDIELCRKFFSPDIISVGLAGTEFGTAARYFINRDAEIAEGVVPVGYAVEDKEVLVLDEDGIETGFNQISP